MYNSVFVLDGGRIVGYQDKIVLPNVGPYDEKRTFCSGVSSTPVEVRGLRLGILVCEDFWSPSTVRAMTAAGAEILVVVNGSHFTRCKQRERLEVSQERVREAGLPLIYVNLLGGQDDLVFDGARLVLDGAGKILLRDPLFSARRAKVMWRRTKEKLHLSACRREAASGRETGLQDLYQAVMLAVRDYAYKNRFRRALLGLSGGIDSALCATLAADALGAACTRCVMLWSAYTRPRSRRDAALVAEILGVRFAACSIADVVDSCTKTLHPFAPRATQGVAGENIQARTRALILNALSNASGELLLTTGNKSELAVGYATLYGDMCGGFNPLKDLYKTDIYALARWRNVYRPERSYSSAEVRSPIPESVLRKAPSAELRPEQQDSDSLPPYNVLDSILRRILEEEASATDLLAEGYPRQQVADIWNLVERAQHKRRQACPGPCVSRRDLAKERRMPITNRFSPFDADLQG